MFFVILIQIEGHKFTSFCNYSVLPFLNKVYYYYYYYYSYMQFSESIKHEGLRPWKMSTTLLKSVCLFVCFFCFWCIRNFYSKTTMACGGIWTFFSSVLLKLWSRQEEVINFIINDSYFYSVTVFWSHLGSIC